MTDYTQLTYGRNEEVATIFRLFDARKDISQHGPRRLGKTFVLDRLVEQGESNGYICLKVEIAGCADPKVVFRLLCEEIEKKHSLRHKSSLLIQQRLSQLVKPRGDQLGAWHQPILNLNWESYLERLLSELNSDKKYKRAILIDELPIFLKALHDKGQDGVIQAREFMNLFSRLRSNKPDVRWLVTGSIGIEPLARAGNYMGVLAKFHNFSLEPLSVPQAIDYLQDLAQDGLIHGRQEITKPEALAVIEAVGWRAAYYLEAFAQNLPANPETESIKVKANIDAAMATTLKLNDKTTFGTWEEHIRKHHSEPQRILSFGILNAIAPIESGLSIDALLTSINDNALDREDLRQHVMKLIEEGFLYQECFGDDAAPYRFRIAILRQWWKTYRPQVNI